MFHYFMSVLFCLVQDWKVGDRVLAKWQDGKFYPGKIVKPPHDGKIINVHRFSLYDMWVLEQIFNCQIYQENNDAWLWVVVFDKLSVAGNLNNNIIVHFFLSRKNQ